MYFEVCNKALACFVFDGDFIKKETFSNSEFKKIFSAFLTELNDQKRGYRFFENMFVKLNQYPDLKKTIKFEDFSGVKKYMKDRFWLDLKNSFIGVEVGGDRKNNLVLKSQVCENKEKEKLDIFGFKNSEKGKRKNTPIKRGKLIKGLSLSRSNFF